MRASPRTYGGTVAAQAAQLEQALQAAGRDVDDPHIWDIWQQRGLKAALNELENKHMALEVRYSPARFAPVAHLKLGAPPQEAQTVWQQLDRETWLQIEIRRNPQSYSPAAYVKEAKLMRGQQANGAWQSSHQYSNPNELQLVEDASAPEAPEPTAAPADNAGAQYIARNYDARAALGERPSIDEIRRKQGMW